MGLSVVSLQTVTTMTLRSVVVIGVEVVALMVLVIVLKTASVLFVTGIVIVHLSIAIVNVYHLIVTVNVETVKSLMDLILMPNLLRLRYQAF